MTAHPTIDTATARPAQTREQRFYADKARKLAAIRNLIKELGWLADELQGEQINARLSKLDAVEFRWLTATDAATAVWPDSDDLQEHVAILRDEQGLDEEGYPLTDDGYADPQAERVFIPYSWRPM